MCVLSLGCGKCLSIIFHAVEYDMRVWAAIPPCAVGVGVIRYFQPLQVPFAYPQYECHQERDPLKECDFRNLCQ